MKKVLFFCATAAVMFALGLTMLIPAVSTKYTVEVEDITVNHKEGYTTVKCTLMPTTKYALRFNYNPPLVLDVVCEKGDIHRVEVHFSFNSSYESFECDSRVERVDIVSKPKAIVIGDTADIVVGSLLLAAGLAAVGGAIACGVLSKKSNAKSLHIESDKSEVTAA